MDIRFAGEGDIPGMIDLLRQVGEVHHAIRPDLVRAGAQKYDEAALKKLLADPNRPILAAVEGEALLGYAFCILRETRDDPVMMDRRVLYIDDLCVDENHRGRGVAKALYDRAVALARELRCDAVTLNVWWGNDRALAFYKKCGLQPQKIGMEYIF